MLRWTASDLITLTAKELHKRLVKVGVYFASKERQYLNVSQPYKRSASGKRLRGLDPSQPGEFPRKLSGQLQRSITWRVEKDSVIVGSNLRGYPSYLETSTRFMAARPWLSLGFDREKDNMARILVGK